MAPQQNSTLIDDNLETLPSLINICERDSCSPILPPPSNCKDNKNAKKYNKSNRRADNCDDVKRRKNKADGSESSRGQRCRSVSLYGVNSTTEFGNMEIPVWLNGEPRYVSGVTNKTTCNDVIKALIDDELRSGNYTSRKRSTDGAASRDYSDYVITESWRGIERSYDGNLSILPVWKAWSRVHNEIRLSLKHRSQINNSLENIEPDRGFRAFRKYLMKLLRFARKTKTKDKETVEQMKCLKLQRQNNDPDEFFFVLWPDNRQSKAVTLIEEVPNILSTKKESSYQAEAKLMNEKLCGNYKLYRLSENTTKKHRLSSRFKGKRTSDRRRSASITSSSCIKRRKDLSNRNASIRNQLAQTTGKVNHLFDREYALTKQLSSKCKLYKWHNYLYMEPEKHLELSVGEIQRNIEKHAEEIIKTEHELLEVKNEIKQDISIINNLKRLSLSNKHKNSANLEVPSFHRKDQRTCNLVTQKTSENPMQFVDNIYEFCDNNASILV